jgi:hypothetical protein
MSSIMNPIEHFEGLSEYISLAIQEYLAESNVDWPHELTQRIVRVEAFLEDEGHEQENVSPHSLRIASVCMKPGIPAPALRLGLICHSGPGLDG